MKIIYGKKDLNRGEKKVKHINELKRFFSISSMLLKNNNLLNIKLYVLIYKNLIY